MVMFGLVLRSVVLPLGVFKPIQREPTPHKPFNTINTANCARREPRLSGTSSIGMAIPPIMITRAAQPARPEGTSLACSIIAAGTVSEAEDRGL